MKIKGFIIIEKILYTKEYNFRKNSSLLISMDKGLDYKFDKLKMLIKRHLTAFMDKLKRTVRAVSVLYASDLTSVGTTLKYNIISDIFLT